MQSGHIFNTIEGYTHALQNGKGGRRYAEADIYQNAISQVYNGQYANGAAYKNGVRPMNTYTAQQNMRYIAPTQKAGVGLADVMENVRLYGIQPAEVTPVETSYDPLRGVV